METEPGKYTVMAAEARPGDLSASSQSKFVDKASGTSRINEIDAIRNAVAAI
jgi:hypothetical protein